MQCQDMEPFLPLDILDSVLDHLAKEATRQRPLLEEDELAAFKVYLIALLRLGASCRVLHSSSRRALWRSVDLDVSPRPHSLGSDGHDDNGQSVHVLAVFPFDLTLPLWSISPAHDRMDPVVIPKSGHFSLPVEHVRKLSILVYSSSRPGVDWQRSTLMRLLRLFPGPLRSVHIHGVTLPNPALSHILLHLSPYLTTFTLSQHGKVLLTESDHQGQGDWVYDLNHITLPFLERMYFEAWLSLPGRHPSTRVQVKSLPNMPVANTVNVKARAVSSHIACNPAFSNMFFWVKHWSDPHSLAASPPTSRLRHLGVFIEKDPFPFDSLPPAALDAIQHLHVKAVVLTSAAPFARLAQSNMSGLRDLTLTNFLAASLAHVPWTLLPNLKSLSLVVDAEDLDRLLGDGGVEETEENLWGMVPCVGVELPSLISLSVSHVQLVHGQGVLRFHCPQLARLTVPFDPAHLAKCIEPPSVWDQLIVNRNFE